jgi:hypothetical protein
MRLDDLCAALAALPFPSAGAAAHPERETVLAARAHIAAAVTDSDFLADCFAHELDRLAARRPLDGLVPFHVVPELGIRLAFGYWPAGSAAGPHEHTAWTITAVCHNRLDVRTFDRAASYATGALVPKHSFSAEAGRTGYIYEPCIHEPFNPTDAWSLSLHVTSPRDGEPTGDPPLACLARAPRAACSPAYGRVRAERTRARFVEVIASIAAGLPRGDELRARCAPDRRALVRTAPGVPLACHATDDGRVALVALPDEAAPITELVTDRLARAALGYAAARERVDVDELPGDLTADERVALACALEATGHFHFARSTP